MTEKKHIICSLFLFLCMLSLSACMMKSSGSAQTGNMQTSNTQTSSTQTGNTQTGSTQSSEQTGTKESKQTDRVKTAQKTPSLFVASDSTAKHYDPALTEKCGWGDYLQDYLTSDVEVKNRAVGGCSSRTYINQGHFDALLDEITAGDIVLIEFGQNDSNCHNRESFPDRYTPPCGDVKNPKEGSYEYCIEKMVKAIKEKNATPVLCAPGLRFTHYDEEKKQFVETRKRFRKALKGISKYLDVPYIDLNALMAADFNTKSYDTVKSYYYGVAVENPEPADDRTHFTYTGANQIAKLICSELDDIIKDIML